MSNTRINKYLKMYECTSTTHIAIFFKIRIKLEMANFDSKLKMKI